MAQDILDLAYKIHTTVDLSDPDEVEKFTGTGFKEIAGHFMAVHRLPTVMWENNDAVELGAKGIVPWGADRTKLGMHITHAGTPHHIPHGFGFWHINDADEVYIWTPGDGPDGIATLVIIERLRNPGERDMFAWYCQNCLNLLHCVAYPSGDLPSLGWPGSAEAEGVAVAEFNNTPGLRVCKECGTEHPMAYRLIGLEPNDPAEEEARFVW